MHRCRALALAALGLAACAPLRQGADVASLKATERRNVSSVTAARSQLDSAIGHGRVREALQRVPQDLVVELPRGMWLNGRTAILRWIEESVPGARLDLLSRREGLIACSDGAVERGTFSLFADADNLGRWLVSSGRYAARWKVDEGGVASLERIVTGGQLRGIERDLSCEQIQGALYAQRRFSIAVAPGTALPIRLGTTQLRTLANEQGFVLGAGTHSKGAGSALIRETTRELERLPLPVSLATRYDFGVLRAEAIAQLGTAHHMFAYRPDKDAGMSQAYRTDDFMLILSRTFRGFSLGVGPALTKVDVAAQEAWMGANWPGGMPAPGLKRSSASTTGVVGDVGYRYGISRSGFLDGAFRYRAAGAVQLDSLWFYRGAEWKPREATIALSAGFAF